MSAPARPALRRLADRLGILPEYTDTSGERRPTSDRTRIGLLAALGIDGSTEDAACDALGDLEAQERARLLEPVRILTRAAGGDAAAPDGVDAAGALHAILRVADGPNAGHTVDWSTELREESGAVGELEGAGEPGPDGTLRITLGDPPPEGYHTLRVRVLAGGRERTAVQSLIVAPGTCPGVAELAGRERVFGIVANLYALRSARDWGIGDLTDLGALLEWTAGVGGEFVGINPLHALRNSGSDVSPYSPLSRVFRNPIYLDIEAVPELAASEEARARLDDPALVAARDALRAGDRIEYERVWELKRTVLEPLHRAFRAGLDADPARRAEFRRFMDAHGEPLARFATFMVLAEELGCADWRRWPARYREPGSAETGSFRSAHADRIDFHAWLQFELDRQLGTAAARGGHAGLAIGIYQDLAIGTSPAGADVWAEPSLFVRGASLGAPPDEYAPHGQDWGLPPLDPRALRESGYRYWIRLLRAAMRHAGALRIDHAMGMFRQFWIPEGMPGVEGAYVRFPSEELLGILALEARRHRALVVGEDLGTVPPEVPPELHRRGVLSSRVFYFERDAEGFRPASAYAPMALATANTHDMVPLAGFWAGRDIEIRRETGILADDQAAEGQRRVRDRTRRAIRERLAADGVLPVESDPAPSAAIEPGEAHRAGLRRSGRSGAEPSGDELRGAVHAFLCRTPSVMVGIGLHDLTGETEPVNLPGVPSERFPSWTRKLSIPLEALGTDPGVRVALRCEERGRKRERGRP